MEHLQLTISPRHDCQFKQRILEVVLSKGMQWYQRLDIVMDRAPLEIISTLNKTWTLVPKPLVFSKSIRIMAIFEQDVEVGTTIIMPKGVKSLIYARSGVNFSDLMFFPKSNEPFYGLILKQFYLDSGGSDSTLRTLLIQYQGKQISAADIAAQPSEYVPTIEQVLNME